jgi:hypothetical protein
MTTLRTKLIRLAHETPALRPYLLPLVKTAALDAKAIAKLKELDAEFARLDLAEVADKLSKGLHKPSYEAENLSRSAPTKELQEVAEELAEARTEMATVALRLYSVRRTIQTLLTDL